jgi:molecular chaperone Hsp33
MNTLTDSLHRFLFEHSPVRGEWVHLNTAWHTVQKQHDYPPALRSAMGELMAAAALLAAMLKLEGALILQIQGSGPVSLLVVECDGSLNMRATAKWSGELAGQTLAELVGDGRFVITLDPKDGGQTYQGVVALEGETVAEILQNYMQRSEQIETRLWLAADADCAAGFLLQRLPGQEEPDTDVWPRACQLAATIKTDELLTLSAQELLHRLFHEEDIRLFDAQPVSFRCSCSRQNVATMLRMLGRDEVQAILDEQDEIEVHCEFCNARYAFDKVDAAAIFSLTASAEPNDTRH